MTEEKKLKEALDLCGELLKEAEHQAEIAYNAGWNAAIEAAVVRCNAPVHGTKAVDPQAWAQGVEDAMRDIAAYVKELKKK